MKAERIAGKPSVMLKPQTLQVSLYSAFGQTEEKPDAENSEWKEARRLKKGDVLFDSTGRQLRIRNVSVEKRRETVYNFTVEGEHDYYVGEDGVLVHNDVGCINSPSMEVRNATAFLEGRGSVENGEWTLIKGVGNALGELYGNYKKLGFLEKIFSNLSKTDTINSELSAGNELSKSASEEAEIHTNALKKDIINQEKNHLDEASGDIFLKKNELEFSLNAEIDAFKKNIEANRQSIGEERYRFEKENLEEYKYQIKSKMNKLDEMQNKLRVSKNALEKIEKGFQTNRYKENLTGLNEDLKDYYKVTYDSKEASVRVSKAVNEVNTLDNYYKKYSLYSQIYFAEAVAGNAPATAQPAIQFAIYSLNQLMKRDKVLDNQVTAYKSAKKERQLNAENIGKHPAFKVLEMNEPARPSDGYLKPAKPVKLLKELIKR